MKAQMKENFSLTELERDDVVALLKLLDTPWPEGVLVNKRFSLGLRKIQTCLAAVLMNNSLAFCEHEE